MAPQRRLAYQQYNAAVQQREAIIAEHRKRGAESDAADAKAEASCLLTGQYRSVCSFQGVLGRELWASWIGKKYLKQLCAAGAALHKLRVETCEKLSSLKNVPSSTDSCHKHVFSRRRRSRGRMQNAENAAHLRSF